MAEAKTEAKAEEGGRYGTPRNTPYQDWQAGEGVPIYTGSFLENLHETVLAPWARFGVNGAIVSLAEQQEDDGWVFEIPPASQSEVLHHAFEASIYVVEGRGATTFWQPGTPPQTVEWQAGSLLAPPMNCFYQHFNPDGQQRVRLFIVTNAPMVINAYKNTDFLFNNPYVFKERFNGDPGYFSSAGEYIRRGGKHWNTNFIPDVRKFELEPGDRGGGDMGMQWILSNNQSVGHCSEFDEGTYKKAHRHGVGAYLIILEGTGYSLMWFGDEERRRVDWKEGTVISPQMGEYHQHFNTTQGHARYMAFRPGDLDTHRPKPGTSWNTPAELSGIPYEEEDPAIYDEYVAECAKRSAKVVLERPRYITSK